MNNMVPVIFLFIGVVVLDGIWFSKRGKNTRTVLTGPTADQIAEQRLKFQSMTVAQLKEYIQQKRMDMGYAATRTPTIKSDLVEEALGLWTARPW